MAENDEEFGLPQHVVDEEAYLEFIQLQNELSEHPDKIYECSNGKKLNLAASVHILKRQFIPLKLSDDEQTKILNIASKIRELIARMTIAKRKAYGTLEGAKGVTHGLGPVSVKQAEVLDMMGRFFKDDEIHKTICVDWGFDISLEAVRGFRKQNIDKITELQREYEQSFSDVRLGKRRSRLDEYTWLYNTTKSSFVKTESKEDRKFLKELLESIKKEVDGDLVINGKMQLDIQQTINMTVQQDMLKDLNITQLVLSRIAGRLNVNPMLILSRLARSHYAKFTGFSPATKDEMDNDEIYYPSGIALDFEKLLEDNARIVELEAGYAQLPEVTDVPKVLSLKEQILAKMNHQKQILNIDQYQKE